MAEQSNCPGSCCEGKCFDDRDYIQNCIQSSCCEGYCYFDSLAWARQGLDNCCDSSNPLERCGGCCFFCYCNLPLFCIIVGTFWMMVFFFLFFMPPLIIVLLQTPMLRPVKFQTFDWIETKEVRADTSDNVSFKNFNSKKGHVEAPCACTKKGWFRCFIICTLLCILGWFPGVLFASGMIIYFFVCLCKDGWH